MTALRSLLFAATMMAAMPAAAQQAENNGANADIVVTARSLEDTRRALADCLARNCPPAEDIAATLAHAENQFVTGDYRDARATMLASLRRNRSEGATVPVELSGLYRANARVAAHLGEARAYQLSVLDMRDTLRENLPQGDGRVFAAEIEVADSRRTLGYPDEARDAYARIARNAAAAGHPRVAAFAQIRLATMDLPALNTPADQRNTREVREALANLERISGMAATAGADISLLAEVLLARQERDAGNMTRTTALMQRFLAGNGATRPLLISGEPVRLRDQTGRPNRTEGSGLSRIQMSDVTDRWIDVGFWVEADGSVREVEVLRSAGDRGWVPAVERSIRSRRYTPLAQSPNTGTPGFYMIERYTITATIRHDCTGSRMACRDPQARVERMDLTPEDVGAQPERPAAAT